MSSTFIFSIDPSINNTGWSYMFFSSKTVILLDGGVFRNKDPQENILNKMRHIFNCIAEKLASIVVDAVVVEETLVNINPFTSLKLAKGQGAGICGSFLCGKPLYIYSCKSARKNLLHNGNATKKECRIFVESSLGRKVNNEHIADSILIAMVHHYKHNPFLYPEVVKIKKLKKILESTLEKQMTIGEKIKNHENSVTANISIKTSAQGLDTSDLKGLNSSDLKGLDTSDLKGLNSSDLKGLDTSDLKGLDTSDLKGLDTSDLKGLDTSDLKGLDSSDLKGLDTSDLKGLDTSDLKGLDSSDLKGLDTSDLKELDTSDLKGLDTSDLKGLDTSDLQKKSTKTTNTPINTKKLEKIPKKNQPIKDNPSSPMLK